MSPPLQPASGTEQPCHKSDNDSSEKEEGSEDECFSFNEYDLEVVDHALMNPHSRTYHDHFGFLVEVKTDDEQSDNSSDDTSSNASDSDSDQDDHDKESTTPVNEAPEEAEQVANDRRSSEEILGKQQSSTTASSEYDDDTDHSVDTAMTTPTVIKQYPLPTEDQGSNRLEMGRGRSTTLSHQLPLEKPPLPPTTRRRAMTVSRPTLSVDTVTKSPPIPLPEQPCDRTEVESVRSTGSSDSAVGRHIRTESGSSRFYSSLNPFKRSESPTPAVPAVERPSQVFKQRQSRRMSELYRLPTQTSSAPSSPLHTTPRMSYSGAASHFTMLMAKLGRTSEDCQRRDSTKHILLKEDARQRLEEIRTTASGYDWDFWTLAINDFEHVFRTQQAAVKHHLITGMPPPLRGMLWQIIAKSHNNGELASEYRELLKRISPHEKLIRRDLDRTFPNVAYFQDAQGEGQTRLFNVTKAYGLFDQQVGYCQGVSFIVGILLLQMPDDVAFGVLIQLMGQYGLRNQYMSQMEALHERLYQFEHIMQQTLPELHGHLQQQGIKSTMYASQWFLTLFAYKCPLPLVYRVFDLVIVEGPHMMIHFALALMQRNQQVLLTLDFEGLVHFLNHAVYDAYKDDENGFVRDAYSFDISPRVLQRLAKQYSSEAARESTQQSVEEQLRRTNAELVNRVRQLEKSHKALENDHREVTQQVIDTKMSMARMDDEAQQLRRQLAQARSELEHLHATLPDVRELERQNTILAQRNLELANQLSDVEAILMSLQLKYAESEHAYDLLAQQIRADRKVRL